MGTSTICRSTTGSARELIGLKVMAVCAWGPHMREERARGACRSGIRTRPRLPEAARRAASRRVVIAPSRERVPRGVHAPRTTARTRRVVVAVDGPSEVVRVNEQSDERSLNVCAVLGKQARSMVPTAASDDAQGDPQPQLRVIVS